MILNEIKRECILKISLDEAWDFFSNPNNLSKITPPKMNFRIKTELPNKVYSGMIIEYKISPVLKIDMGWVTEIKYVDEPYMFVDEQRFGPYKFWHHKHIFTEVKGGILMQDIVHYALPFGFIGKIVHALFVKREVEKIFEYRNKVLKELFG